jgi:hypothetical protein
MALGTGVDERGPDVGAAGIAVPELERDRVHGRGGPGGGRAVGKLGVAGTGGAGHLT